MVAFCLDGGVYLNTLLYAYLRVDFGLVCLAPCFVYCLLAVFACV